MKKQLKIYGITVLLLVVGLSGCINQESDSGTSDQTTDELSLSLDLVRKIEVADGFYPGIIFTYNQFYVSYEIGQGAIYLKIYDENFNDLDMTYLLADDDMGADHQKVFGNNSFYLVGSNFLYKFDSELNMIKSVRYYDDLNSKYPEQFSEFGVVGDMLFYYADGFVYLGVPIGDTGKESGKKLDLPGDLLIQKYNENLELVNETTLEGVGNVPGSSMMLKDGIWTIVCGDKRWDDSSLIVARYSEAGVFIDKKTISAVADANEEFAMGLIFEDDIYYVGYQHITGDLFQPTEEEIFQHVDVMLKVFDLNWSLLGEILVTNDDSSSVNTGHMGRPHLALVGNKIYVAYDSGEAGGVKIFVKEYEFKE